LFFPSLQVPLPKTKVVQINGTFLLEQNYDMWSARLVAPPDLKKLGLAMPPLPVRRLFMESPDDSVANVPKFLDSYGAPSQLVAVSLEQSRNLRFSRKLVVPRQFRQLAGKDGAVVSGSLS
jgi:hypothetical protein